MPKITEMFCFAIYDKDEYDEGVPGFNSGLATLPMVGANLRLVEKLTPIAQQIADTTQKPIRIYKFSVKEQIGEISPRTLPLSDPPVVHGLRNGFALCGFAESIPMHWPAGHLWVDPRDTVARGRITCQKCVAAL